MPLPSRSTCASTSLSEHSDVQLPIDNIQVIGCPNGLPASIPFKFAWAQLGCTWLLSHPSHAACTIPPKWLRDYEQYICNIYMMPVLMAQAASALGLYREKSSQTVATTNRL